MERGETTFNEDATPEMAHLLLGGGSTRSLSFRPEDEAAPEGTGLPAAASPNASPIAQRRGSRLTVPRTPSIVIETVGRDRGMSVESDATTAPGELRMRLDSNASLGLDSVASSRSGSPVGRDRISEFESAVDRKAMELVEEARANAAENVARAKRDEAAGGQLFKDESSKLVRHLNAGEAFGELALINSTPRTATVVCTTQSVFFYITKAQYDATLKSKHREKIRKRQAFLRDMSEFTTASRNYIQEFAVALKAEVHAPSSAILRQGTTPRHLYFVKSGECQVIHETADGSFVAAHLGPGQSFGIRACLTHQPSQFSIVAVHHVKIYSMTRRHFSEKANRSIVASAKQCAALKEQWYMERVEEERTLVRTGQRSARMAPRDAHTNQMHLVDCRAKRSPRNAPNISGIATWKLKGVSKSVLKAGLNRPDLAVVRPLPPPSGSSGVSPRTRRERAFPSPVAVEPQPPPVQVIHVVADTPDGSLPSAAPPARDSSTASATFADLGGGVSLEKGMFASSKTSPASRGATHASRSISDVLESPIYSIPTPAAAAPPMTVIDEHVALFSRTKASIITPGYQSRLLGTTKDDLPQPKLAPVTEQRSRYNPNPGGLAESTVNLVHRAGPKPEPYRMTRTRRLGAVVVRPPVQQQRRQPNDEDSYDRVWRAMHGSSMRG